MLLCGVAEVVAVVEDGEIAELAFGGGANFFSSSSVAFGFTHLFFTGS